MHSAAVSAKKNKELRAAAEKKKRKKKQAHTFIAQNGVLTAEEGLARAQAIDQAVQEGVENSNQPPRKRAPPRCSKCNIVGHTARTCQ
ncbi:hypothetical protein PAAG_11583 [Paracoccidioides lutzii Pb01]|uniref:CCHC-type domain-containing protein n=1 Tax=Paracoccidioides lutzii (strain ATCC MYA-826 / Pb01) TaxID=502779 RepID=A0A0A2V287_PARBA|nr:hypothetical protein PAAG_11583 [Paracoccidioides lutzii Pb01]KGQ01603.1 hypothetical protein PAAG_11583 [Paracoccidioides lutzii Pb01]